MNRHIVAGYLTKFSDAIESVSELSGRLIAWLVLFMVLLVSYDVSMRYLFSSGSVALQELEWHVFSLIFLLGAAYTLKHDDHVRLDLIYKSDFLNDLHRSWINLLGGIFILIPFCLLIIFSAVPFVEQSFTYSETSPDPGGLPYRWILKFMIPFSFSLLMLQAIAGVLNQLSRILNYRQ